MNNLTELSKKVYQLQIEKGWCKPDEKRDIETLKILILSEAFEAFEAYRKNLYCNHPNLFILKEELKIYTDIHDPSHKEQVLIDFKETIKDTFQDEIADVAIRALDLAGYLELDFGSCYIETIVTNINKGGKEDFPEMLGLLSSYITIYSFVGKFEETLLNKWYDYKLKGRRTGLKFTINILSWCKTISKVYNFDLMQHIELKLAYNKTRPFRHGNKVV